MNNIYAFRKGLLCLKCTWKYFNECPVSVCWSFKSVYNETSRRCLSVIVKNAANEENFFYYYKHVYNCKKNDRIEYL